MGMFLLFFGFEWEPFGHIICGHHVGANVDPKKSSTNQLVSLFIGVSPPKVV